MSQEKITLFTCDRCKKQQPGRSGTGYEDNKPPAKWTSLSLLDQGDRSARISCDLCDTCSPEAQSVIELFMKGAKRQ